MNIFVVDKNPRLAAVALEDRHVVKMTLETAQILSTISWKFGVEAPYRSTHRNHPCVLWAGLTFPNWSWLLAHGLALGEEFERRYGHGHKSAEVIKRLAESGGRPEGGELTEFAQAMPEKYRSRDAVEAYRGYYIGEKLDGARWTPPAEVPSWIRER